MKPDHERYGDPVAAPLEIHVIADSTGETAARLARAAQAQFPTRPFRIVRHPRIHTAEEIMATFEKIHRTHEAKGEGTETIAVMSTLVDAYQRDLVDEICADLGFVHCDLLGPALQRLEVATGQAAERVPMRPVGVEANYYTRIAAMEFAVRHDDGQVLDGLKDADIVLIGVSRSGKTPLSMYLGYLGYKTANVPLVAGHPVPEQLHKVDRWRLVGLTIDPERLAAIRHTRVKHMGSAGGHKDGYDDLLHIRAELDEIRQIQRRLGCPIIDQTGVALEESASTVIDIVEDRARIAGTRLRPDVSGELIMKP